MKSLIDNIEKSKFYRSTNLCEPFLTKHKLKKTISGERTMSNKTKNFIDIIAYSDGKNSLEDISKILKVKTKALNKYIKNLLKLKIIKKI